MKKIVMLESLDTLRERERERELYFREIKRIGGEQ